MIVAVLGALAFLISWLTANHYPPWNTFHSESLVFVALALLSMALLLEKKRIYFDPSIGLPILLVGVVALQWITGLIAYRGDAILSTLYLTGFAFAWLLGSNAARETAWANRVVTWFAVVLISAATVSVYIATLQWLGLEAGHANLVSEKDSIARPGANLGQANHLGTLLLMAIAMSLFLYEQQRLKSWQFWALLCWLSLGVTLTESRTAWLSAIAMGALLVWRGRRWIPWGIQAVLVWWGMLVSMWISWKPINDVLLLPSIRSVADLAKDPGRLLMWRQMAAGIELSPWWGYGWRQTVVGHKAGSGLVPGGVITDYSHSLMLDLCLWVGLPLAVLLMLGATWWLLRTFRRLVNAQLLLLTCGILPVLVHSLVEFPFAYAYFLFTTAALLGFLSAWQQAESGALKTTPFTLGRTVPALFLLAFAGLSAWVAQEYVEVEEDFRVMRFEMRNVGKRPEGHEIPKVVLLDQLGELLKLGRVKPFPGMPLEDIERLRISSEATMWATGQIRYVIALGLNGRAEEATQQLIQLRGYYGEKSYKQAKTLILELQRDEYPQLATVKLP